MKLQFLFVWLLGALGLAGTLGLAGCHRGGDQHQHGAHGDATESESPPVSSTRWSDEYELFVELSAPVPGKPVRYHAHVTRLADFTPVTEGTIRVRYTQAGNTILEAARTGVKRPGIFVFESAAPKTGKYELGMSYEHGGKTQTFDVGAITVTKEPGAGTGAPTAAITFLKESQWKIPFGTASADERALAKELELAATVEPAAKDQLTVGAPTGGRFFHNPKILLAEGARVKKGDVLGTIAPTVAGDDYSRLQYAVEEARLAKQQIERELARVEPLVQQDLLPERRLIELRNELETERARLDSAGARLTRVASPGGEGGVAIRSNLDGLVSQVLAPNGEPVVAGTPLVRIGGTEHFWIRARFIAKPASSFIDSTPSALRFSSGERLELAPLGARFLSTLPVVDPVSRIATWIVDVPALAKDETKDAATPADFRPGASVVLTVRFGAPQQLLAVPREAVVEINTRPYVFVQLDGEHFEKRAVTLGRADGGFVALASGVQKGERIVTKGGFDVHLATLLGTVESHRH